MPFELHPVDPITDRRVQTATIESVQTYLAQQGWIEDGEQVAGASRAGEGNMNRTVRITTDRRSLILKQSLPYCAKFPEILAPIERIETEVGFYSIARRNAALAAVMPRILGFAPKDHLACIEDLGEGSDLLSLYAGDSLLPGELETLCSLAHALHSMPITQDESRALENRAMRILNHEHIFDLPLRPENGLDLDSITDGLQAVAEEAKRDDRFVKGVSGFGLLYLNSTGPSLLHGDYYPGSFLRTTRGLAIIDPEFAFPGPPEFDLSVLVAHMIFAGGDAAQTVDRVLACYGESVDTSLLKGFAAAELMRRTLGVSQLPLRLGLEAKRALIEQARSWIENP